MIGIWNMVEQGKLLRRQAVAHILAKRGDILVVTGLGSPTYERCCGRRSFEQFLSVGAMGSASCGWSGLGHGATERRVLVMTGDGEMLMGLGGLATE